MKKNHTHKWGCSNIPAWFKCVEKTNGEKCSAIRIYDYRTKKSVITTMHQANKKENA